MTTLVVGATGNTGRWLVRELLDRDVSVKAIVRSPEKLSEEVSKVSNLSIVHASILDLDNDTLAQYVKGCAAVASRLGHSDIFAPPYKLVTEAVSRLCAAVKANKPDHMVKFVLLNTVGNSNRDLAEPISFAQRAGLWLVRLLLPPHSDNEQAAEVLRVQIGQNDPVIEWAVVRPDTLIDADQVTEYELYPSPIRDWLFNPGKTSRINVGHFMADLITEPEIWDAWKGQMPAIYNAD
ncbi:MAG: SDR family oxidoreductase [Chloroflexi bacterium]|nr:SDR family oxidoreductase [Chloroflexota bacterium]